MRHLGVRCCAQARLVAPDGLEIDLCLTALICDQLTYLVECGSRSGGIDLLRGRLGRSTERCVVGDAVAVAVGGDNAGDVLRQAAARRRSSGCAPSAFVTVRSR